MAIYADDTILKPKCGHASDLCQKINLAPDLESGLHLALKLASDQHDTEEWCRKYFVNFTAGKIQLV